MEIVKQTPSQLICRTSSPLGLWMVWIFGFLASLLGISLLFFRLTVVGLPPTLNCQRISEKSISCLLKKYKFPLSLEATKISPGDLQGARLERDSGSEGTYRHRAILVTRRGEIPMKEYYSFRQEYHQNTVDRINNFMADDKQKSISIRYNEYGLEPLFWCALDLVLLTVGIVCLCHRQISAQFDRALNRSILKQTNAFGTKIFEHSLSEIAHIVLEEGRRSYEDGTPYKIFIVTASGDRLLLSSGWNISNKQREMLANIREYLNIQ